MVLTTQTSLTDALGGQVTGCHEAGTSPVMDNNAWFGMAAGQGIDISAMVNGEVGSQFNFGGAAAGLATKAAPGPEAEPSQPQPGMNPVDQTFAL